jgi:hypothetical protein
MSQFIVNTHGRLQEWIADAKGYFREEGLDYLLTQHQLLTRMSEEMTHLGVVPDNRHGAYQTYEQGRDASISCACHWTVNMRRQPGMVSSGAKLIPSRRAAFSFLERRLCVSRRI